MIKIQNLQKRFGSLEVLKGIDLEVKKGEVVAIIGSSGTGKSTLLRCMNYLETPDAGSITIGDITVESGKASKKEIHEMMDCFVGTLRVYEVAEKYNINVNLCGGGYKGQAEALRLAIARALVKINADDKAALRAAGFVTRDPRAVERKKPGRPKARKRFQFSKR